MEKFQSEKVQVSQFSKEHKEISSKINALYKKIMSEEACFTDKYGQTSLLKSLGLDWKRDISCLITEGQISGDEILLFIDKINNAQITQIDQTLLEGAEADKEEWEKFFEEKRANLINLLKKAMELNEPLQCSI